MRKRREGRACQPSRSEPGRFEPGFAAQEYATAADVPVGFDGAGVIDGTGDVVVRGLTRPAGPATVAA